MAAMAVWHSAAKSSFHVEGLQVVMGEEAALSSLNQLKG